MEQLNGNGIVAYCRKRGKLISPSLLKQIQKEKPKKQLALLQTLVCTNEILISEIK